MTREEFAEQVETMITNLGAIQAADGTSEASAHTLGLTDYPLAVCECAAHLGGFDATFAKMWNRTFREAACNMMFERAQAGASA